MILLAIWSYIAFPERSILAVSFGLQQIWFIVALVFDQIYCKSSDTFGEKALNVPEKQYVPSSSLMNTDNYQADK